MMRTFTQKELKLGQMVSRKCIRQM